MNATAEAESPVLEMELAPRAAPAQALSRTEIGTIVQAITAAANDPKVDVEKMERLWSMHERMQARVAEQEFHAAMSRAQASMTRVSVDAVNPQTRSTYASYAQLDRALRPVYTQNGFALSFDTGENPPENCVRVLCYVSHSAGHMRTYHCDMPADGKGAKGGDVMTKTHASGSAMTYGMRYLLKLIFNVAIGENDDDGASAGASGPRQATEADRLCDDLMARLAGTKTDAQAAALWAEGSKTLAETRRRDLYTEFKDAVIKRRKSLSGGGRP